MAQSAKVSIGDNATAAQYNALVDDTKGGSFLHPHQQSAPNMTLKIEAGQFYVGAARVVCAGGNTPAFTAPTTNPRIDLVTIDSAGTVAITQGTEAASPSVPSYPEDKVVICEVYHRVGETSIKDADDSINGYIQRDVRPLLRSLQITDAQVASGAAVQVSKIRRNAHITPEADNTYDLGSSSLQWKEVRAKKLYKDNIEVGAKFGGDSSDGALTVSSNTNIDAANAAYVVKNYSSLTINNGITLGLINPHGNGTLLHIKVSGDFTWNGKIDLKGKGASGGAGAGGTDQSGNNGATGTGASNASMQLLETHNALGNAIIFWTGQGGMGGGRGSQPGNFAKNAGGGGGGGSLNDGGSGNGGSNQTYNYGWPGHGGKRALGTEGQYATNVMNKFIFVCCGGGGAGGGRADATAGDGGRGGGGILIEVAGNVTIGSTAIIDLSGDNGTSAGGGGSYGAGGGGGGAAGIGKLIAGGTITNNGLTKTLTGGSSGSGSSSSGSGGAGSSGSFETFSNKDFV